MWSVSIIFLLVPVLHVSQGMTDTDWFTYRKPSVNRHGDLMLGGFFPLYYTGRNSSSIQLTLSYSSRSWWLWKNYQYVLAFYFAIQEINKDPHLLPNLTLGFQWYNAFPGEQFTLWSLLYWLTGNTGNLPNYICQTQGVQLATIVGTASALSIEFGTLLELYKTPQLTFGPFDPMLNDKKQLPSLYQMASSDSSLSIAMITLLLHFGWTWVALFVSDDMKGEQFLQDIQAEMLKRGVCVALTVKLPVTKRLYQESDLTFMSRIQASTANVHILYGDVRALINVDISVEFFLTMGKVWVMASKWDIVVYKTDHILHSLHGSFSFFPHREEIHGLKDFLKTVEPSLFPEDFYFSKLWLLHLDCSPAGSFCGRIGNCSPNASLGFLPAHIDLMTLSDSSYLVYNAVYAVAHVTHTILMEKMELGSLGEAAQPVILPWQLHPVLRKLQFRNSAGDDVSLADPRHGVARYDIQNVVNFPAGLSLLVKIGEIYSTSSYEQGLLIHADLIEWPVAFKETPQSVCSQSCGPGFRILPQEGRPICCYTCVFCPEREMSNQTDAVHCVHCSQDEYPNRERTQCFPKLVTFLALESFLGTALACMALALALLTVIVLGVFVKHQDTPIVKANNHNLSYILLISLLLCFLCSFLFIGRPNTATCLLRQITFALMFTLAVSAVLAKTITVVLAFKAMKPGRTMRRLLVSGAPKAVIPICFLIQLTLCGIWLATSPPFVDTDAHSEHEHIILLCNEGSITAFYCVLGFLGSLALGTFTVAFLARNLPDTFNEAKFLTFSMLVFCSVWVTFLPVYHSTKGKVMVAVEVFSILASGVGLLGCIFAPKCYIILIKPEKNSLKSLKKKTSSNCV
ncbi:vomeronasal type-2 receptor 116-like [Ochotona princeps]|uniref:vomeronasal type-2 receptor 116-like n=1 Tax=Ochotona princeps TaxID=9978 RepID=UPI0027148ED8|nr:vomeronasal type-2 receptor 116-like [Ochotona princeps]